MQQQRQRRHSQAMEDQEHQQGGRKAQRPDAQLKSPDSLHEEEPGMSKEAYVAYRRQIRDQRHQQRMAESQGKQQEPHRTQETQYRMHDNQMRAQDMQYKQQEQRLIQKQQRQQMTKRDEDIDTDRELQSYMERHRPERRNEKPERRHLLSESQERLFEQEQPRRPQEPLGKEHMSKQDKILLQEHYMREMELAKSKQQRIDEAFQAKPTSQQQYGPLQSPGMARSSGSSPALFTQGKGPQSRSQANHPPHSAKSEQTLSGGRTAILSPPPSFSNGQRFDFPSAPHTSRRPECPSPNRAMRRTGDDGYDDSRCHRFPASEPLNLSTSLGHIGPMQSSGGRNMSPHPPSVSANQMIRASPTQMHRSTSSPQFNSQDARHDGRYERQDGRFERSQDHRRENEDDNDNNANYAVAVVSKSVANHRDSGM